MREAAIGLSTKQICLTAVMGAFVFLATFVPKIPIPLGYAHLGDAAVFLAVAFVGRREGIVAGCLGSALADLVGGFPLWVGPTLIIKWLMADIFWHVALKPGERVAAWLRTALGLVLACLAMAAGYTVSGAWLYGSIGAGLASTPGLLMKGAVNILVFYLARKTLAAGKIC